MRRLHFGNTDREIFKNKFEKKRRKYLPPDIS